jgi:hypothetical protein
MELKAFVSEWLDRIPEFEVEPGFIPQVVFDPRGMARAAAVTSPFGGLPASCGHPFVSGFMRARGA